MPSIQIDRKKRKEKQKQTKKQQQQLRYYMTCSKFLPWVIQRIFQVSNAS
jgi:hypothetical protein